MREPRSQTPSAEPSSDSSSEPNWDALFPWIEQALGARIVAQRRQVRESGGRPAWFVDLEIDGRPQKTYVRGTRDAAFAYTRTYTTEREARIVSELERAGIPVPGVLAFCPDPPAIVMNFVEGQDNFNEVDDPVRREAIARHFMELLVDVHALDSARFEKLRIERPATPEDYALSDLAVWERSYESATREPVPLITFTCDWLRRNAPSGIPETVLVQGDTGPGNFIFAGNRVAAITDWEMAHLGDPMDDLALIRSRDLYYDFGDLGERFGLYAELSGRTLDLERIRYYTVKAMIIVPLALAPVIENLNPRSEHAEWIAQYVFYERTTPEALADAMGIALAPPDLPDAPESQIAPLYDILLENLRDEQTPHIEDPYLRARMGFSVRLAEHLRRIDRYGGVYDGQELDDLGEILGRRPASTLEGRRALDRFIREHGEQHEEALVRHFHRRALRQESLMRGALGMAEGRALSPIDAVDESGERR